MVLTVGLFAVSNKVVNGKRNMKRRLRGVKRLFLRNILAGHRALHLPVHSRKHGSARLGGRSWSDGLPVLVGPSRSAHLPKRAEKSKA